MEPIELLEQSWKELQEWAATCKFDPVTEVDIQCFLYHLLVQRSGTTEHIHAELPHRKGITDLVVNDKVFIEIIYILRSGKRTKAGWNTRTKNAREETRKLQALRKEDTSVIGVLAVFAKTYMKKDEPWYHELKQYCDEAGIKLLRAYKTKTEKDITRSRKAARAICRLCGKHIGIGNRSIHLVEVHRLMPPEKWLQKNGLPQNLKEIADFMKKNEGKKPVKWMYEYFEPPDLPTH